MRLKVPVLDGRTRRYRGDIIDEDTGRVVGNVSSRNGMTYLDAEKKEHRRTPSWLINLFGKYSGRFETWEECKAFAEGVEGVLDHMTSVPAPIPFKKPQAA